MTMKNRAGLLIGLLFLSISSLSLAGPNKWDGFRGMKWGTNIKDLNDPNMVLVEDANEYKGYRRLNDKLSIGSANLKEIIYTFYKDRFYGVKIEAEDNDNFRLLKEAVFAYYGEGKPRAKPPNSWLWTPNQRNSRNVTMFFSYDEDKRITKWAMSYIPILKEIQEDRTRKAAAKKGI
jgi:hypothetical protein